MRCAGNDIVDLTDPEVFNKHRDERFMSRVFTLREREMIEDSLEPNQMLWMVWACKEAAYKMIRKAFPDAGFLHQLFQVTKIVFEKSCFRAFLHYKDNGIKMKIKSNQNFIHAFGETERAYETKTPSGDIANLKHFFNEDEWKSIHSPESAWVRYFAKMELAKELRTSIWDLAIVRGYENFKWDPPAVYWKNIRTGIDISLSHHGKWLAWAWSFPKQDEE